MVGSLAASLVVIFTMTDLPYGAKYTRYQLEVPMPSMHWCNVMKDDHTLHDVYGMASTYNVRTTLTLECREVK